MAKNPLKYYQNVIYHLETVRNKYKSFMDAVILPNHSLSVIDIGCGSGRIFYEVLLPLLPNKVSKVVGSDIDQDMIEFCRSMNSDPKISFEQLDIAGEILPKHLENKFDLLFTSYCFSYVRDWRQGLLNCRKLLKPSGELSFVSQFETNALYTTYRRMSRIERWKSYTRDYENYATPLSGENPDSELKKIFEDVGLKIVSHNLDHDSTFDVTKRQVRNAYISLERKVPSVPQDQQEAFTQEFLKICSEEIEINFLDENSLDDTVQIQFPTVQVHAKK